MVRPTEQHANPKAELDALIELLTTPPGRRLRSQLLAALKALKTSSAMMARPVRLKPPQGQVLRTIKQVLEDHPEGLRTNQIRHLVEQQLGRSIGKSTINDRLVRNPSFERISRGKYCLRTD